MKFKSWWKMTLAIVIAFTSVITAVPVAYTAPAGILNPGFEADSGGDGIPDGWSSLSNINILSNAGFEEGTAVPTDWTSEGKKANSMDRSIYRSGSSSARLAGIDGGWTALRHKDIPVEAGATYKLSSYVKTENVNLKSKVYMHFGVKDQQGNFVVPDNDAFTNNLLVDTIKGTHDWMKIEGEYTIPAGGASISYLRVRLNPTKGTTDEVVWYDDLVIRKVGGIDSTEYYDGHNSLKVVGNNASAAVTWWSDEMAVLGGRIYNIGAYWKALSDNGNAAIQIEMKNNEGISASSTVASAVYGGDSDWKELPSRVFVPEGTVSVKLGLQTSGLTTVWFDGVWLTEDLAPQPAQLTISGEKSIKIPNNENVAAALTAIVYDQFGNNMAEEPLRWSIDSTLIGVSMNEHSGLLTITDQALSGSLTIRAETIANRDVFATIQIELQPSFKLQTEKKDGKYVVTVTANHVGDLYGYELQLQYDKSLIELKDFKSLLPGFMLPSVESGDKRYLAGTLIGDVASSQGEVPLATFQFHKVKQNTTIVLEAVQVVDGKLKTTTHSVMQSEAIDEWNSEDGENPTETPPPTTSGPNPTNPPNPTTSEDGVLIRTKGVEADGNGVKKLNITSGSIQEALGVLAKDQKLKRAFVIMPEGANGSTEALLPIQDLLNALKMEPELVLTLMSNDARYDLPLKAIDLVALMKQFGTDAASSSLSISLTEIMNAAKEEMKSKAKEAGIKLFGKPYEFKVGIDAGNRIYEVNSFGQTYVTRSINIPGASDLEDEDVTGLRYDPLAGKFFFVPSYIQKSGTSADVVMLRPANSIYTIGSFKKTFADMNSHWAKADVERLASKLIIEGVADERFAPSQLITRAEFSALLVRALGLNEDESGIVDFKDMKSTDWYAGAVGAAVKMKLIEGYEDGTFRANEEITREQLAVMMVRAMIATGKLKASESKQVLDVLKSFEDADQLASWSSENVAIAIDAGIIQGITHSMLEPKAHASRAQAAVMLKRMLIEIGFITP